MTRALLSLSDDAPAIADDLRSFGVEVLGEAPAGALVREIARQGADLLVTWDAYPTSGLLQALTALREHAPVPVLLFTSDASALTLNEALHAGVDAYVVNGYERQRLRPLIQLARARFERDTTVQQAHAELAHRFEERKLVDRAKGILMRARQVPEDEAFKMLRDASMQGHQRVGLVSRRVIDAARDAEAVNRAGQLRMLSQYIVKLAALHHAGVPGAASEHEPWSASVQRVDINLEHLQRELSPVSFGDLLDAVGQSWQALKQSVRRVSRPGGLAAVDGDAERLLQAADHLVSALEAASPLATLDIVNRAGRLRMLSQRLAKQALLATLLDGEAAQAAAAEAVRTIETFEAVLHDLSRAPLSSPAIQAGLDLAQQQWQQMLAGVRGGAGRAGRETIASASERLLECFERLTHEYEQAVQQLFTAK